MSLHITWYISRWLLSWSAMACHSIGCPSETFEHGFRKISVTHSIHRCCPIAWHRARLYQCRALYDISKRLRSGEISYGQKRLRDLSLRWFSEGYPILQRNPYAGSISWKHPGESFCHLRETSVFHLLLHTNIYVLPTPWVSATFW